MKFSTRRALDEPSGLAFESDVPDTIRANSVINACSSPFTAGSA